MELKCYSTIAEYYEKWTPFINTLLSDVILGQGHSYNSTLKLREHFNNIFAYPYMRQSTYFDIPTHLFSQRTKILFIVIGGLTGIEFMRNWIWVIWLNLEGTKFLTFMCNIAKMRKKNNLYMFILINVAPK